MRAVSFLEQNVVFLNRWEQYIEQFPKIDTWFVIYDTSWADENKKNKIVTFAICPAIGELDELMQCLDEDLVTDIKSRSHISEGTIKFLKNNLLFFSISVVITKPKEAIPLDAMKKMLDVMEARVHNAVTDAQKRRLKKYMNLLNIATRRDVAKKYYVNCL